MAGERNFPIAGEDANLHTAFALDGGFTRNDESRLLETGFACEILHLAIAEAARVQENGERIALQASRGEDVNLNQPQTPRTALEDPLLRRGSSRQSRGKAAGADLYE